MLGVDATEEQLEELREHMGLNLPLYQQYFVWIGGVLQGDFGTSYFMNEPVLTSIIDHLYPTLSLSLLAIIFTILIAIPLGIAAANRRGTFADQSIMGVALFGMSVPSFLLGLLLSLFVGVHLGWLPVAGYQPLSAGLWDHLRYLILPAISLGAIQAALVARMTRTSMLEVLSSNYIKTAQAKGVKKGIVIYKHALR